MLEAQKGSATDFRASPGTFSFTSSCPITSPQPTIPMATNALETLSKIGAMKDFVENHKPVTVTTNFGPMRNANLRGIKIGFNFRQGTASLGRLYVP